MAKRSYSDEERATALAALEANEGNISKTSADIGIPRATLTLWAQGGTTERLTDICQVKKASLADRLEEIAHKLVDAMPGKIGEAPLKEVSVALGIAVEKCQLLRQKPTEITQQVETEDERRNRLAAILGRGEDRAGAPVLDAGRTGGSGPPPGEHPALH